MKDEQYATERSRFTLLPAAINEFAAKRLPAISIVLGALVSLVLLWADYTKSLWFDELLTLHIARLPLSDIWRALIAGTDNNPPLFYLPVHALLSVVPSAELAVRLPSTLAFLAACFCLYRVGQRYMSRPFAIAAAFLPLTTFFVEYADEGRAYAFVVCFAAFSFYFWQSAIRRESGRTADLVGLALSIGLALGSHFCAPLVVAALGAGELARTLLRRRLDWPVVLSMSLGAVTILLYLPILHALRMLLEGSVFWSNISFAAVIADSRDALTPVRALLLILVASLLLRRDTGERVRTIQLPPVPETVAWIVLLMGPLEGYIQSKFTGAFTLRYAMVTVLPFSLGVAMLCGWLSRRSAVAALVIVCVASFVGVRSLRKTVADHPNDYIRFEESLGMRLPGQEPLVVGTPLMFLPFHHHAPEPLRSRVVYLSDPTMALKNSGTNTPDINLTLLSKIARVGQIPYASFIDKREPFALLVRENDHFTWVEKQLRTDGFALQKLGCAAVGCLYQVSTRSSN